MKRQKKKEILLKNNDLARVYSWFARAFSYPVPERIEELKGISAEIEVDNDFVNELFQWSVDLSEINKEQLEADFVTLFINGYPKTIAPPYESLYRGSSLMLGTTSEDVIQYYVKYELEPAEDGSLPDALAIELDFVAFLITQNPSNVDINKFINEHIFTWVEDFIAKINESDVDIYKKLGTLFLAFVSEEKERINS